MTGGEFHIIADSPPGQNHPAKLDCDFLFEGGHLGYIGAYWTFEVTGNVTWTGGNYAPRIDVTAGNGAGLADIWQINGTLTIPQNSTAQISPSSIHFEGGLPANFRVLIFDIRGGLTQGSKMPTLVNQSQPVYQIFVFNGNDPNLPNWRLWKLGPG
jgi:hypothetical protein